VCVQTRWADRLDVAEAWLASLGGGAAPAQHAARWTGAEAWSDMLPRLDAGERLADDADEHAVRRRTWDAIGTERAWTARRAGDDARVRATWIATYDGGAR
jgi:hypothetical protein